MAEIRDIKRLNYFTGQFLVEKDFNDEQAYHVDMRRLHNRWLHSWGVANGGLQVEKKADKTLAVAAGLAIDKDGNEIVVLKPHEVSLDSAVAANATVYVTARYQDVWDSDDQDGATGKFKRRTESAVITPDTAQPATDGSVILLATVKLDANGNIESVQNDERRPAGPAPGADLASRSLRVGGTLTVDGAASVAKGLTVGSAAAGSNLSVHGNLEMNHKDIRLGAAGDGNHFLGYRADGDGPTLSGNTGGALIGMNTPALSWYGAHVTVHGDLKVIGHAALEKGLTVSGAVTNLQHGLNVSGAGANLQNGLTVTGDAILKNGLTVEDGVANFKKGLTVGGLQIGADGTLKQEEWRGVTPGELISQGWIHPTGQDYNVAGYFKDSLGIVHLRGVIENVAVPAQRKEEIFRLPEGYRPASRELHIGADLGSTRKGPRLARVEITKDGAVRAVNLILLGVGPIWLSLDGITFRAAAPAA